MDLVTQGYLPKKPLQEKGGHPTGIQLLRYTLVFDQELFPRLTYMQYLIAHIEDPTTLIPGNTKNIITYDPLQDNGEEVIFRPRPFSTHPHLRPTVNKERLSFVVKNVFHATKYQGDTAITIPPFFQNAGRGTERIWGDTHPSPQPMVINWPGLNDKEKPN